MDNYRPDPERIRVEKTEVPREYYDPNIEALAKAKRFWIQTFTGRKFYPLEPKVGELDLLDQAIPLSRICRYGGHTDRHYSVAEHAWRMSIEAERRGYDDTVRKWCLIHDNAEAYLGDMVRPLKAHPAMKPYRDAEEHLKKMIAVWCGLPETEPPQVMELDRSIYSVEAPTLKSPMHPEWNVPPRGIGEWELPGKQIFGMEAKDACAAYLWRFRVLFGDRTLSLTSRKIYDYL